MQHLFPKYSQNLLLKISIWLLLWKLSQNTNNAREARLWRHTNDDIIEPDIGLKLAESENEAEILHPQL